MDDEQLQRRVDAARLHLEHTVAPEPPQLTNRRERERRRNRGLLVAVAGVIVLLGVIVLGPQRDQGPSVIAGPPPSGNSDLLTAGTAQRMSSSPLSGRSTMAAVWTGTEVVIWGGDSSDGPRADGAGYDPRHDSWRVLGESPLSARNAPAAVWTGRAVLFWGGNGEGVDHADGAAYDPAEDTWRRIADAPMPSAGRPIAVWTGTEMIAFAGFNSRKAASYDPAVDRWRVLPDLPGQLLAPTPTVAWTGTRVIAVVGSPVEAATIYGLEPGGTTWTALPRLVGWPRLVGGQVQLAWTGERLLAVAGGVAAVLDTDADTWVGVAEAPTEAPLGDPTAVWTGTELLLWSGGAEAFLVDPSRRTWRTTPAGDLDQRVQSAAVWADGVFVAWGGFPDRDNGIVLRPSDSREEPSGPVTILTTDVPDVVSAVLVPVLESGVSGRSRAQKVAGSSWDIDVTVEGARPATKHVVYFQDRLDDGSVSEIRAVCDFTSDSAGSGTCSGHVDAGATGPFRVSVGGYDESSRGYRTVAVGEFDRG